MIKMILYSDHTILGFYYQTPDGRLLEAGEILFNARVCPGIKITDEVRELRQRVFSMHGEENDLIFIDWIGRHWKYYPDMTTKLWGGWRQARWGTWELIEKQGEIPKQKGEKNELKIF